MIKYSHAIVDGKPIHIEDVTEELRASKKFYCTIPDCNQPMAAHLKGNRAKHFQHINYTEHPYESYLHETAKQILKENYLRRLSSKKPFFIRYEVIHKCNRHFDSTKINCDMGVGYSEFDLIKYFDSIEVEKRNSQFYPDLRIFNKKTNEHIYFEIVVTSISSQKKIYSNNRIIEFKIENEDDLELPKKDVLSVSHDKVFFYNFKKKVVEGDFCKENEMGCRNLFEFFYLYKNGKFRFEIENLENISLYLTGVYDQLIFYNIEPYQYDIDDKNRGLKIENLLDLAKQKNYTIKSSSQCRYVGENYKNEEDRPLFCKFLREPVDYPRAGSCEYFRKEQRPTIKR